MDEVLSLQSARRRLVRSSGPTPSLVVGTIPGAQRGGWVSKIISTKHLRLAIAVIIAITGLRMWYQREMFHGKIQP